MQRLLLLLALPACLAKFSRKSEADRQAEVELAALCKDRGEGEFFRLEGEVDCRLVHTCDRTEGIRLAQLRCASGLYFDMEKQTCDWSDKVTNCDTLALPRRVKPNLATDSPVCPEGQLQCGSGECLDRQSFCDRKPDCQDGSDENVCSAAEDPNRAPKCDPSTCLLPDCFCSTDGTRWPTPGGQKLSQLEEVPMMITMSFNGAVSEDLMEKVYDKLFKEKRENPNGCRPKGSFFVSHKFTDYSAVQRLHKYGHNIGVFSITNKDEPGYWSEGSYDTWLEEMAGARLMVEKFANITDGTVIGVRAPFLRAGGNPQFEMMSDQYFAYDSSLTAPLGRLPVWPYTLKHRVPHKCIGTANCPSRSFPLWEMPINMLDRREKGQRERMTGCHHVSSCTNIYEPEQLTELLDYNFEHHYKTNRAPLSLAFNPAWLLSKSKGTEGSRPWDNVFVDALDQWMTKVLREHRDVYFVNNLEVIQWMQNPTRVADLNGFEDWKVSCQSGVRGHLAPCLYPNSCLLTSPELPGQELTLRTCMDCPKVYPWLLNPEGETSAQKETKEKKKAEILEKGAEKEDAELLEEVKLGSDLPQGFPTDFPDDFPDAGPLATSTRSRPTRAPPSSLDVLPSSVSPSSVRLG